MKNTTLSRHERTRLGVLKAGQVLLTVFLVSTVLLILLCTVLGIALGIVDFICITDRYFLFIIVLLIIEFLLFWTGIILVYLTSIQLGIRERIIGIAVGWIPLVNVAALIHIICVSAAEWSTERKKDKLNLSRAEQKICHTRYPILLVHGVFFRDFRHFNYWGRIPRELKKNGALYFYGNHQSASSVADSAAELTARIKRIVRETGCEKVNVIAHSKGGLDIRYACSCLDAAPYVASLTTINTPHRGCEFADYLFKRAGDKLKDAVASAYNAAAEKLGDDHPDFIAAVADLTSSRTAELNQIMSGFDFKANHIYTQSVGSCMKHMTGGRFPLNMSYHLVKYFDGENDGLVGYDSFAFGENFRYLEAPGYRGISHGDMIDLNREDISGFDVREFYVELAADLKRRGL